MTPALPSSPLSAIEADQDRMRRVARGDTKASRQLVDEHLVAVTRFAHRMLGSKAEAEDVAQETFLRLWRQASDWEPRARVSTWLHRVAHNLCIDRLRARREVPTMDLPEGEDQRPSVPAQIDRLRTSQTVADALASLPERQRAAISLVYYEGLGAREAAEVMGVHEDAVESLLARARRALRKQIADSESARRSNDE